MLTNVINEQVFLWTSAHCLFQVIKLLEKYHFQKGNKLNEFIESSFYLFFSLLKYARSPACWGWLTTSFEIFGVSWWQGNAFYHLCENSPKFGSLTSIYGCFREIQSLTAKSFENSPHYKASQAPENPNFSPVCAQQHLPHTSKQKQQDVGLGNIFLSLLYFFWVQLSP